MKPSTVLASVLPSLAFASPAVYAPAAPQQQPILVDTTPKHLKRSSFPLAEINDIITCLKSHKGFETNLSVADKGIFMIDHVEPTCCKKGEVLWSHLTGGQYGYAFFNEPCDDVILTGVSKEHMNMIRVFFERIADENE
ncbi:hypothetical protein DHEL01_v207719 [Diaporthe helianthi]|uniref:Uncharacterized protein n=1 Tax=Diaporthe helianthi TaxID=158607 RepID=A0A2P5HUG7_DIAHE|nr:hypothetical protein DHEL01_v207719 [Diaporthe helianthi]